MGAFQVKFQPKGCESIEVTCDTMDAVAMHVANANDARSYKQYFQCLRENPGMDLGHVFDEEPIYVQMRHKDFKYGLRLIDLPGLTRGHTGPMEIAKKYI